LAEKKNNIELSEMWIDYGDIHSPKFHKPTRSILFQMLEHYEPQIKGFIFGGDQFDNQEISHHTRGKPRLRNESTYKKNTELFDREILKPIEQRLSSDCQKIWIQGNHDYWEDQLVDEHPELEGTIERRHLLNLESRGWQFIECGKHFTKGKLKVIHGEQLAGIGNQVPGNAAKKALEIYCSNVLFHHFHKPAQDTKILPHNHTQKWMSWCSPIAGETQAAFLRNRATGWLNGFNVIEYREGGLFNLFPVIVINGAASYGGRIWRAK
jgi:hypothetical protein